jgi:hypothetical protein
MRRLARPCVLRIDEGSGLISTCVYSSALDAATSMTAMTIYVLFGGVLMTWDGPRWWGNSAIDSEHCVPGS